MLLWLFLLVTVMVMVVVVVLVVVEDRKAVGDADFTRNIEKVSLRQSCAVVEGGRTYDPLFGRFVCSK